MYGIHLEKVDYFILEQIRIIEVCPFDHYHALNHDLFFTNGASVYGIWGAFSPTNYTRGKAVKGLKAITQYNQTHTYTYMHNQHNQLLMYVKSHKSHVM